MMAPAFATEALAKETLATETLTQETLATKTRSDTCRPNAARPDARPDARRVAAEARGRIAECAAALALLLRGYRILGRRVQTGCGEIDLIAVRGNRLAFVEVKQRATWAKAEIAMTTRQTNRLYAAAARWVAARPYYREHLRGFDSMLIVPWRRPSYRRDALQPEVTSRVWVWG